MNHIPRIFYKVMTSVVFLLVIPSFFIVFILLYRPENMVALIETHRQFFYLNTIILSVILLAVVAVGRMLLFILRRHLNLTWIQYSLWCFGELVISALFMGMYLTLVAQGEYNFFTTTGKMLGINLLILVYPYLLATLIYTLHSKAEETVADESHLVRFTDSGQRQKVIIAAEALIYIEAKENYVTIHYLEQDSTKEYTLHNTMVGIEPLMSKHGLVRCQRSYYINPLYVKVLRRDKGGTIMAELKVAGAPTIPVSPKYYDQLAKLL